MATANGGREAPILSIPTGFKTRDSSEETNRGGILLARNTVDLNPSQQPTLRTMDMVTEQTSRRRREGGAALRTASEPLESSTLVSPRGPRNNSKLLDVVLSYDTETPSDLLVAKPPQVKLKSQRNPKNACGESLYSYKKDRAKAKRGGQRAPKLDSKAFTKIVSRQFGRWEPKIVAYDRAFSVECSDLTPDFVTLSTRPQSSVDCRSQESIIGLGPELGTRSGAKHASRREKGKIGVITPGSPPLNGRAGFFGSLFCDDQPGPGDYVGVYGSPYEEGPGSSVESGPCGFWIANGRSLSDTILSGDGYLPDDDDISPPLLRRDEYIPEVGVEGLEEWGELWASWPQVEDEIPCVVDSVGLLMSGSLSLTPCADHEVASDLNGNNGSCTNTDDLDQEVEYIANSVSRHGDVMLHLSLLDKIGCLCDQPHSHMVNHSHVSKAHKAFLERQRKRSGAKEVKAKDGPPKEGKKKPSNLVKFGTSDCVTPNCRSPHIHLRGGALVLNESGVRAYDELPDVIIDDPGDGIEMKTVYGDSLRNEPHVQLEPINAEAPSNVTRGIQVVDEVWDSGFRELLSQSTIFTRSGVECRVDPDPMPEIVVIPPPSVNVVLDDGVRKFVATGIGVLKNDGSVRRNGGRRDALNMCFLISISAFLTSRDVFKSPFELQAQFFPDHAQDSEYEIGLTGKDYLGVVEMLASFDARLELWGEFIPSSGVSEGWNHTGTIGIGQESWHVATFPAHFEPIVKFSGLSDGDVSYFHMLPQFRQKVGGRFNSAIRLLDCRFDATQEPGDVDWNLRVLDGRSSYWRGVPPGRVENIPLVRAKALMVANGGKPEVVIREHLKVILSSERSLVEAPPGDVEMVDLHPTTPPTLEQIESLVIVNPMHLGCPPVEVQPPSLQVAPLVDHPLVRDPSIPFSPSDNTNSLSRRLLKIMNLSLAYPDNFKDVKRDVPIPLETVRVLPKEFLCSNSTGVYVDTAFVDDILMNMSSVSPDCYSLFQEIEDYFQSLIRLPVSYALPEDVYGAQHTLKVDLMYETRPTFLWRVLTLNFAQNKKVRRPKTRVAVLDGVYTSSMRVLIWKDLSDLLMREASSIGSLSNQDFWTWCIPRYKEKVKSLNPDYLSSALVVEHDIHGHISHSYNTITCNTICHVVAREAMSVGRFALSMPRKIGVVKTGKSSFGTAFDMRGKGSVGGVDTFMGVIKASRLMCSGVAFQEGLLKQGDNYTIRSTYECRLSGVYDEGFTRILPMECPNSMDWEYNRRYTFVKGKKFVKDGKITFPPDEESRLYQRLNYSHRYISVYGYAFANSGMVYGVNNHNISRIVERHFKRRQPEALEVAAAAEYGFPLENFDILLLANQSYFASYLTVDFVRATLLCYGPFEYYTDVQEASSYLIWEKHIKQQLRIDSFDDIMSNGEIGKLVFKSYLVWKLKQMEIAKQNKAPRCVVDAQTANSLPNVHISNAWKAHTSNRLVVYGGRVSIEFCSCPSPEGIEAVCCAWDEYSYDIVIKNYSDDSIIGIWDKSLCGYVMYNTDIRANDGSHSGWTWSVFSNLLCMPFGHSEFLLQMIFAENYLFSRDRGTRVTFRSQYGYLPSGIGATTIANNTAMLMVAWMLSRFLNSGFDPKLSLVTYAAYRCGFLLSFEHFDLRAQFSRMQFLKYSPVRHGDGSLWVLPNLGRMLRYSGRSKQDVTVKLYQPPLLNGVRVNVFLWYQTLLTYGDFKRVYYEPLVKALCPYFDLVDSRHTPLLLTLHPDDLISDVTSSVRLFPSREQFYSRYISYGATDTMIDEFEGLVAQLALGGVMYSPFVDLVLLVDYGLVSVCSV